MWYEYKNGEKVTRFSIRKYHFGAASVAVASLIFFGGGMSAKAENVPVSQDSQNNGNTASNADNNVNGDSGKSKAANNTPISVDVPASALPTAKVDKAELNKLTIGLDKDIRATDAEKIRGIAKELDKVLTDAKELLKNENATATEVKKQVEELTKAKTKLDETVKAFDEKAKKEAEEKKAAEAEKASKEAKEKANAATEENKEVEIPKKRGRKSNRTEVPVENADSSSTSAENTNSSAAAATNAKQLPTYTNGSGTYALKDEMDKIVAYLRKNGGDETKIELIKKNSDKLNEKLGLADEDGVISEEDFNKALQDLDYARATIEGFLADKENGGKTELPKPEAILNRQERLVANNGSTSYDNSKVNYFEDGKHGASPYLKYTYVYYNRVQTGVSWDNVDRSVSEGKGYIYADVTPTKTGFRWDLYINQDNHQLAGAGFWFTVPKD